MNTLSSNPNYPHSIKQLGARIGGAALSIGLLTSCSVEAEQPPSPNITSTATDKPAASQSPPETDAATQTKELCGLWNVEVDEYFNPSRAERIDDHLDLLEALQGDDKLKLGDIRTAASIIRYARADPRYADGINQANQAILQGATVSSDDFLAIPVSEPAMCSPERTDAEAMGIHLANLKKIGGYVTAETSEQLTQQGSKGLGRAIEQTERQLRKTVKDAEDYLNDYQP